MDRVFLFGWGIVFQSFYELYSLSIEYIHDISHLHWP